MFNNPYGVDVAVYAATNCDAGSGYMSYHMEYSPPERAKTKCEHCGQWGKPRTACEYCGAPIDPDKE
jgi:hypothetical protein